MSTLKGFHYKSSSAIVEEGTNSDKSSKTAGGRKAVLIAFLKFGSRLVPAAYIELQMPLLMVKPRHIFFNEPFNFPSRNISWERWDIPTLRKYVNLIVRVARVVTAPDFRGIGLTGIVISAAKEYSRERWHVSGRRPLFMEVSAEMLKTMDFASSAGFHFIGLTEGNLSRVHADLLQMNKGQKVSFGIMTLQKKYLTKLQSVADAMGRPFLEVLDKINELTEAASEEELRRRLNNLSIEEWYSYKKVLRFPIPYYICGLEPVAEEYISSRAPANQTANKELSSVGKPATVYMQDVVVSAIYNIADTPQTRAVRDCFGLEGAVLKVKLVGPVSIEASNGNILLITGASGSGKSVLLRILDPKFTDEVIVTTGEVALNPSNEVAWMVEINSNLPLIEYFSEKWGVEASLRALNRFGLSEAFVYLKPYSLLSRGQQYRARLAELSLGSASVWLMDEFCADLDPFTARVVASNLRKYIVQTGRVAIVAAANNTHYVDALRPNRVVYLRHNGKGESLSLKEYVDEFCVKTA